jgi:hypothetical protein
VHLGNFGPKFAERFMAALKPGALVCMGPPSDAVVEGLKGFSPAYYSTRICGFNASD